MAETSVNYKCPNCSAPLVFQPGKDKVSCEYCGNEFAVSAIEELFQKEQERAARAAEAQEAGWATEQAGAEWAAEEAAALRVCTCPSCGAELVCDGNTMATECVYWGNPTMIPRNFDGMLKPHYVIPFKKTKEEAMAALREFYKGKLLLPAEFKTQNRIEAIQPMYVPFWLFDSAVKAHAGFQATRVRVYETSDERVTETSYYDCERSGTMAFARIPVDGSEKMDDTYMESIEPFDYTEMVPFSSAFLTGFLADKYDVDAEASVPRADKRVEHSAVGVLEESVTGYDTVACQSSAVIKEDGKVAYAMAPVWILTTRYKGTPYTFMMNGQTGKVVGSLPSDKREEVLYPAAVFLLVLPMLYYLAKWIFA